MCYYVPKIYAEKFPQLTASTGIVNSFKRIKTRTIELHDVDEDIGHTLVHFLYTGAYQTLKLQDVSNDFEKAREYLRACSVYRTARSYGLYSLADLAVQNMELLDKESSLFQILDMAKDIYPKLLEDDVWFPEYLKTKIKAAFEEDETIFTQERFLNYLGEAAAFSRVLAKIMVDTLTDKIKSIAKKDG